MSGLLALLLFGVFAVCLLSVLLTGADAYKRLTQRGQEAYSERTAAQYLVTKVRQADAAGAVYVGQFDSDSENALFIREQIGEMHFVTVIYLSEGYLRELFTLQDAKIMPWEGEELIPLQELSFTEDEPFLRIHLKDVHGQEENLVLTLRSEGGLCYEE